MIITMQFRGGPLDGDIDFMPDIEPRHIRKRIAARFYSATAGQVGSSAAIETSDDHACGEMELYGRHEYRIAGRSDGDRWVRVVANYEG